MFPSSRGFPGPVADRMDVIPLTIIAETEGAIEIL